MANPVKLFLHFTIPRGSLKFLACCCKSVAPLTLEKISRHSRVEVMRGKISSKSVSALPVGGILFDNELRGFCARRLPSGRVSYGLKYVDAESGRQRWLGLGLDGAWMRADTARQKAMVERGRIADGKDPQAEREARRRGRNEITILDTLLDEYLIHHVQLRKLRTEKHVRRAFEKYVRPELGRMSVFKLRRGHIVALLDKVAAENGPVTADRVLAYVRSALNWYAKRDENFSTPLVRGMARTNRRSRARDRILTDDKIRALWRATEAQPPGRFATLVRLLLLSGQRRNEVAGMRWAEFDDDVWTVPAERAKNGKPNDVPLAAFAFDQLHALTRMGDCVFGLTGEKPPSDFGMPKIRLDVAMKKALEEVAPSALWKPWMLHDLRRTARSLMSRAGVPADIADRVCAHALPGVRGIYDRHSYITEKRDALESLAAMIERIVNSNSKVVALAARR